MRKWRRPNGGASWGYVVSAIRQFAGPHQPQTPQTMMDTQISTNRLHSHAQQLRSEQLKNYILKQQLVNRWEESLAAIAETIGRGCLPDADDVCSALAQLTLNADATRGLSSSAHHDLATFRQSLVDIAWKLYETGLLRVHDDESPAPPPSSDLYSTLERQRITISYLNVIATVGDYRFLKHAVGTLLGLQQSQKKQTVDPLGTAAVPGGGEDGGGLSEGGDNKRVESLRPIPATEKLLRVLLKAATFSTNPTAWQDAIQMYRETRQTPTIAAQLRPTPQVAHRLILALERGGQWTSALRVAEFATQQQVEILPESYDALVKMCFAHNRHNEVVYLLRRCLLLRIAPEENTVRLGLQSCEESAAVCSQEDDSQTNLSVRRDAEQTLKGGTAPQHNSWILALRLFRSLADHGLALLPQTYEAPLRTCTLCGRWDIATKFINEMNKDGIAPSPYVYRLILGEKAARTESFKQAWDILNLPLFDNYSPLTYTFLLRHCIATRNVRGFSATHMRLKRLEIEETVANQLLLLEGAYMQGHWIVVVGRYARFERRFHEKVQRHQLDVPASSAEGFNAEMDRVVPRRVLLMVLEACEKLRPTDNALVNGVYLTVQEKLAGGSTLLPTMDK